MMSRLIAEFQKDESGQGMVEYILVVVLIALAAVVGMKSVAAYVNNAFISIGTKVSDTLT